MKIKNKTLCYKLIGISAIIHSIGSVCFLKYTNYPIDLFIAFIFIVEFAIGLLMFMAIPIIRDGEYHKNYTNKT